MLMSQLFNLPLPLDSILKINEKAMVEHENDGVAPFEAAVQAINAHDKMAELLCNHRAYFEGIIEHAPEDTPVEFLDMYRGFVDQIDEVLNHG